MKCLIEKGLLDGSLTGVQEIMSCVKSSNQTRPSTDYRKEINDIKAHYGPTNPDFDTIERLINRLIGDLYNISKKNEKEKEIEE